MNGVKRQKQWLQHHRRKKKNAGSEKDENLPLKSICRDLEDTVKTKEVKELSYATK